MLLSFGRSVGPAWGIAAGERPGGVTSASGTGFSPRVDVGRKLRVFDDLSEHILEGL